MNIQISVTVWTVICFVVLMLVLNNLLFKPLLSVMDKRRERIESAKAKKAEADRLTEEHEVIFMQKKAEHEEAQRRLNKERVGIMQKDQKKAVEAAKEVRLHQLADYRVKVAEEQVAILHELDAHVGDLAYLFADSIVKG